MSENRLEQDVLYVHQICGRFCVRRYQQFCTLMAVSLRESRTVVREWECCSPIFVCVCVHSSQESFFFIIYLT